MQLLNVKHLIFFWTLVIQGQSVHECPRFCECDVFQKLNRADCSSKNLISAFVDIPKVVQILDLSYNNIAGIEETNFKSYKYLKFLNLSHNDINSLDLESFSPLLRVVEIDLSYNRLQYFDNRIFENTPSLKHLNLEGNKLMSLASRPFIKSSSLLDLNLRNSQIVFIERLHFSKLPKLQILDLSGNLLNGFQSDDFQDLFRLEILKLSENSIRCDKIIMQKIKQLENKGIQLYIDECKSWKEETTSNVEKFQKIMALPPPKVDSSEDFDLERKWHFDLDVEDSYDLEDKNSDPLPTNEWLQYAPDAVLCEPQKYKLCQSYRKCLENLNGAWHDGQYPKHSSISTEAKFGFILGIACGASTAIVLLTCVLCVKNCCEHRKRDCHSDNRQIPYDVTSTTPLTRSPQQLPPPVRRPPRRRAPQTPARPLVRYEGPVGENFLSRLLGDQQDISIIGL